MAWTQLPLANSAIKKMRPATTFFSGALLLIAGLVAAPEQPRNQRYICSCRHDPTTMEVFAAWTAASACDAPERKGFDTLFALVTWHLWKERNARVLR